MLLLFIFNLVSLIFITRPYFTDQVYTAYPKNPKNAIESEVMSDGSPIGVPSQYAMCGWLKLLYNCNCRPSCTCNGLFICNWCYNKLFTKANSMTGYFCQFNKWANQFNRTIKTGNKQSRNQRLIMCPQNHFITQVSPRINQQGFNGFKIKCSTLNFNSSVIVQDDYSTPLFESSTYQNNFVTAFQLQYQKNSNLEGVKFYFEKPYKITKIQVNYLKPTYKGSIQRKIIEEMEHSNINFVPLQKSLTLTKIFEYFETWKNDDSYLTGYRIGVDVNVNHIEHLASNERSIYYTQQYEKIKFGENTKTTIMPYKSINAIIPSCYKIKAKSVFDQQSVTIPYTVEITLQDTLTGSTITRTATGKFDGYRTSPVTTEIVYQQILNCSQL